MKRSIWVGAFLSILCFVGADAGIQSGKIVQGHFEGTEPFWDMEINANVIQLNLMNVSLSDTLVLAKKQAHTNTYVFQGKHIIGVVRESNTVCDLDITEEPNPSHEIYFSYNDVSYMGCGRAVLK